ncbi:hypothetical protein [Enterococcus phage vB_Efs6_KEN16]|uniref:Uncharacterized protein n=1 Tax=Enterococcus phage vB_Efs6_KEN16 TaxID=3138325 RepID=A0AAX4PTP8_9CAUD
MRHILHSFVPHIFNKKFKYIVDYTYKNWYTIFVG